MQQTTRMYENITDKPVNVVGIGVIPPHDRVSITAEFHTPINLVNYPGVIDVLAKEAEGVQIVAPEPLPASAPANPAPMQSNLDVQKMEGSQNV
jgi:hypothetical protein